MLFSNFGFARMSVPEKSSTGRVARRCRGVVGNTPSTGSGLIGAGRVGWFRLKSTLVSLGLTIVSGDTALRAQGTAMSKDPIIVASILVPAVIGELGAARADDCREHGLTTT
jgi:hypothetical protein